MASRSRDGMLPLYSTLVKHLSCEDWMRELGLFNIEKRRLQRDLIAAFEYLKGLTRKPRDFLQGQVVIGQGGMTLN